jgi:hypothetical protein
LEQTCGPASHAASRLAGPSPSLPSAPWGSDGIIFPLTLRLIPISDSQSLIFPPLSKVPGDARHVSRVCGTFRERIQGHSCQTPLELAEKVIAACSRPGDIVLDPMAGTGTVGEVAVRLGRGIYWHGGLCRHGTQGQRQNGGISAESHAAAR